YRDGIGRLQGCDWPALQPYLQVVAQLSERDGQQNLYPGSPAIAQALLRPQDRAQLYELHPSDYALLSELMQRDRRIRVQQSDGFQGLIASLPPPERRGLVLIDPPYEIKSDYDTVVSTLVKAHKRFATGTYALWYPVVERTRIDKLEPALRNSGTPRIPLIELGLTADTDGPGIALGRKTLDYPALDLKTTLDELLPALAAQLGQGQGVWRSVELAGEA